MNNKVDEFKNILKTIEEDIIETLRKLQKLDPKSTDFSEMEQRLSGKFLTLQEKYKSFKGDLDFIIS